MVAYREDALPATIITATAGTLTTTEREATFDTTEALQRWMLEARDKFATCDAGRRVRGRGRAHAMLLLDSTTCPIHEVDAEDTCSTAPLPPRISFERFEARARSHFCSALFAPSFRRRSGRRRSCFVRLSSGRDGRGRRASASRTATSFRSPTLTIGEEFLFLWPVPMAINAYLSFKERRASPSACPRGLERV